MGRRVECTLAAAVLAVAATGAKAQWLGGDYSTYGVPQVNYAANSFLNFSVVNHSLLNSRGGNKTGGTSSLRASAASQPQRSAAELAARLPAEQRERMIGVYLKSLDAYGQLADRLQVPRDDLGGAAAAFIAGNLMALRGDPVPDAHFKALVSQMQARLAANPAVAQAPARDKRAAYEQLAMVGMFMATSRLAFQKQPNPQAEPQFRQAARANLQQVMKVDPDTLRIGPDGLAP